LLPPVAVVISVEGATTPLSYVHDVLFPFARAHLESFLAAHAADADVAPQLAEVRRLVPGRPEAQTLLHWMDQDAKITPLKAIQGMIWRDGYAAGELVSAVYPDVAAALNAWARAGLRLYGFSHGSVEAQRLILSHSAAGDLSALFAGFFDTNLGSKREPKSFSRLAIRLDLPPSRVAYLSDDEAELDAAATAGMRTCQVARRGNSKRRSRQHPTAPNFPGAAERLAFQTPPAAAGR
jgi:enolase-phosphatase E1